jgi:hypothetical protein
VRQRTDRARLTRFLEALGRRLRRPVRFYLAGGSVMIDLGLRATTLDVDFVAEADDPARNGRAARDGHGTLVVASCRSTGLP